MLMANLDGMVISAKLPTYLQTLLQEQSETSVLLGIKRSSQVSSECQLSLPEVDNSCISLSNLELTGNPLEVDLGGNDTLFDLVSSRRPTCWTAEEAAYQPISLGEARNLTNIMLEEQTEANKPLYCICDGNDASRTVILGAQEANNQLMRILVNILPNCKSSDKICSIDFLKEEHNRNAKNLAMTSFVMTKRYTLFGYDLKNCSSLETTELAGWVCIEVDYNLIESSKTILDLKAILHVVVGHHNSAIHAIWDELGVIQGFINILTDFEEIGADSIICDHYLESSDVVLQLCEIIDEPRSVNEDETCIGLDVSKDSVVDKLWSVLKRCKNVNELSQCLGVLFEQLVESPIIHFLPENNIIVALIRNLLDKKQTIPILTFQQSLELLIDLGLEKVKCYLVSIINKFYPIPENFVQKWNDLSITKKLAKTSGRITDFCLNSESHVPDIRNIKLKLTHLLQMYTVVEHLLLYKNNINLSETYQKEFSKFVWAKFMSNLTSNSSTHPVVKLSEVVFNLDSTCAGITEMLTPSNWSVKMSSDSNSCEVTTAFHFSNFPIFPNTKIDASSENPVYATKLLKLLEFV